MGVIVGVVAMTAAIAGIFAVALGQDALRWAAWGAIGGLALIAYIVLGPH